MNILPATGCTALYVRRGLVIRGRCKSEWYVKAHQQAQGQREQHGLMSNGKGKGAKG